MGDKKNIEELVNRFVKEESATELNPFVSKRIMAAVVEGKREKEIYLAPVWRIAAAAAILTVTVFAGITAGNMYKYKNAASTLLINDAAMEHLDFYSVSQNE